ncbi:hypothetical protein R6V09_39410 [Streptomyces sp. W16]|uniref:hypothetical protein n=1 Tax=Streptomyces sp. W16 TaxID=3076631 RepID=UPI00295B7D3B|nr:hypothetical protein [Streptomyces sp. W16]MDV9176179.1 hypothetical protein [Streptomyces sp. W16]
MHVVAVCGVRSEGAVLAPLPTAEGHRVPLLAPRPNLPRRTGEPVGAPHSREDRPGVGLRLYGVVPDRTNIWRFTCAIDAELVERHHAAPHDAIRETASPQRITAGSDRSTETTPTPEAGRGPSREAFLEAFLGALTHLREAV